MWAKESLLEAVDMLAAGGRADLATDLKRLSETEGLLPVPIMRNALAEDLADDIVGAEGLGELVDCLEQLCKVYEVRHSTFHLVREGNGEFFPTRIITTYPDEWVTRYVTKKYRMVDPVINACITRHEGFFWDSLDFSGPVAETFRRDAASHGVGPAGYTELVTTASGAVFALSISAGKSDDTFPERMVRFREDLRVLADCFAASFCHAMATRPQTNLLPTDDQLVLLRAMACGATEEELDRIEFEYGSRKTVEKSLCQFFSANTVTQAAMVATRLGLLDHAPFGRNEVMSKGSDLTVESIVRVANVTSLRRWARHRNGRANTQSDPLDPTEAGRKRTA